MDIDLQYDEDGREIEENRDNVITSSNLAKILPIRCLFNTLVKYIYYVDLVIYFVHILLSVTYCNWYFFFKTGDTIEL